MGGMGCFLLDTSFTCLSARMLLLVSRLTVLYSTLTGIVNHRARFTSVIYIVLDFIFSAEVISCLIY